MAAKKLCSLYQSDEPDHHKNEPLTYDLHMCMIWRCSRNATLAYEIYHIKVKIALCVDICFHLSSFCSQFPSAHKEHHISRLRVSGTGSGNQKLSSRDPPRT
jgi:hypothetical protein